MRLFPTGGKISSSGTHILRTRARNALLAPLAGRKLPELLRDDIRELIEGNYRIVYQVFEDHLVVLTVFEGHHLLPREKMDSSSTCNIGVFSD